MWNHQTKSWNPRLSSQQSRAERRMKYATDDASLAIKFSDRALVHFTSNFHKPGTIVKQRRLRGVVVEYEKPDAIQKYNYLIHMNGADIQNQLLKPYNCARMSMKWF